jgi:hypothetical protein
MNTNITVEKLNDCIKNNMQLLNLLLEMKSLFLNDLNTKGIIIQEFNNTEIYKNNKQVIVYIEVWELNVGIDSFLNNQNLFKLTHDLIHSS